MPRIREYFSRAAQQGLDVGPLRALAGAQAEAGRANAAAIRAQYDAAAGVFADTGALIQKHQEQDDASTLTAGAAEAHAQLNVKWQEAVKNADPNDPEIAQRFMEQVVDPMLDQLGENVQTTAGQRMYQEMRARIHADLFEKTATDQSSLRGAAAVDNLLTFRNKMAGSLQADPTGFGTAVAMADTVVANYQRTYGVPPEQAMKLSREMKHEFAVAALQSMAKANPAAAKAAIASGRYDEYIDGTDKNQLDSYADQQQNAQDADAKSAAAELRKTQKDAFDASAATISASLIREDGTIGVPENYFKDIIDLSKLPQADPGTINSLRNAGLSILNREARGIPVVTDAKTWDSFRERAALDLNDPRHLTQAEVFQARADGKLSDKDFTFMVRWVNSEARDPVKNAAMREFNKSATALKGYITKSNLMRVDAVGDDRFREFAADAQEKFLDGLNTGKTVQSMLDKSSKDYVFRELPNYQLSKQQSRELFRQQIQGTLRPQGPVIAQPPARNQGESAADYLKRIGGK